MIRVTTASNDRLPEFLALARKVRGADPAWVPPIEARTLAELAGRDAFGRHATIRPLLCESDGGVAACAAAIMNPRLPGTGQIGYFECADDAAAARAVLDEACRWLASQGARQAIGPMHGGVYRFHRFQTSGFDSDPFLFEPRNPAWYPRLWEASGFSAIHRWSTYEVDAAGARGLEARVAGVADRASRRFRLEFLDPAEPAAVLPRLHRLMDAVWQGHPAWAPFTLEEMAESYGGLLAIVGQRDIAVLVDRETGEDVAFGFTYPDYAREVKALDGDGATWGAWLAKARLPASRRMALHTLAARPGDRNRGTPYLLLAMGLRLALEGGYERIILPLVTQTFRFYDRSLAPTREYALYGKALPATENAARIGAP